MASFLSGFEYDIFISYRHNDNRTGWVRHFVEQLQVELATTVKEPLTIYFDENPHDGLLETDIVHDSLKDKLRCVIFIPILSQTYCDPRSFAWHHEFLVFKQGADADEIGLKVKQANGNFTSRILPVRIHNLDADDQRLLEAELGPLRAVDFIFKTPGVNRPLAIDDNRADNLNKTVYNDQVNKVANCIKEIVASLKRGNVTAVKSKADFPVEKHTATSQRLAWIGGITISLLIALFAIYYFANFRPEPEPESEPLERSIAVLPFDDLSQNKDQGYFSDGISEEIINALVKIEGLKVSGRTSSFQFKGKNMDLKEIGDKLGVSLILEGSVRKSGDQLRITAQLINAKNGYHLWSKIYDHELKDIFKAQDDVTKGIFTELQERLGISGTMATKKQPTHSLEAYDLYWKGHQQFLLKGEHVVQAQELLREAVRLDPEFAMAHAGLAEAYAVYDLGFGNLDEAILSANKALALDSTISSAYAVLAWSAGRSQNYVEIDRLVERADFIQDNFERAIKLDPQNSTARLWYGIIKINYGLFQPALEQLRLAVEIDPLVPVNLGVLGYMEYLYGQDSIGFLHLNEAIKMGWKAGNQRLALYYLEHEAWEKAEFYFDQNAKVVKMGSQVDYHHLITAVRKKDVAGLRKILSSIHDRRGFIPAITSKLSYLVGDMDGVISYLDVTEALLDGLRPNRSEIRKLPGFRKFVKEKGLVGYWNKYGWPDVCSAVGDDDFKCD
ncbi:MAG TPA: hypothetical protein VK666_29095 [Chryseolinea sp.]|nr:hypothetical protein [Chryseolinea sp.]